MFKDIAVIIGNTLMYSTPLIYAALGGVISENSGVVNIGLEGLMVIGAFAGAAAGYFLGDPWLAFLIAGIAGGALSLLHALASIKYSANQVVSGIAINFLGAGLALFLSRVFFEGSTMTKPVSFENKMPRVLSSLFPENSFLDIVLGNQYATVYLAFILVAIAWYVLYKTKLGLRIRAVGEHPAAADTLGVNVYKIRYFGVITSGILAGFGGASMSLAIVSNFRPTLVSGHGFIALAAVIFGRWKPQGALLACLFFGFAQGLTVYLGGFENVKSFGDLLNTVPYIITLIVLITFVGKSVAPAADGVPYDKSEKH